MSELIETFVAVGRRGNELFKAGHLQVSREARLDPFHPQHKMTVEALGELMVLASENGLEQTEAIWAATYDAAQRATVEFNQSIEVVPRLAR